MEQQGLNDNQLWSKFKEGDNESLACIYSANSKKLYWYGLSFTHDQLLIEDAIQDLFSELISGRKRLSDTNNIQFYLIKSFKRILLRKIRQEKKFYLSDQPVKYDFEVTYSIEHFIIKEEDSSQQLRSLHEAIKLLTARQKEAIYLKFSEGLDYEETAEIMEMTVESCRNLIWKAVKSLKNSLVKKSGQALNQ
ncbi:MAG: RNA polymerase sigma factor [Mangrovibacterium sp.]|jgi:RNA polymerase sigma factor (sigma-70 family)